MSVFDKYGIFGASKLIIQVLLTQLFRRPFKLLRRPYYIRCVGNVVGGKGLIAGPGLIIDVLQKNACLILGNNIRANHRLHIGCVENVVIGNDVLIASNVYISDHSHGSYVGEDQSEPDVIPNVRTICSKPIFIGDNCWLGENVSVLPGVTIGYGSIIGAGSVVTKDIPSKCIAVGAPAKVIKKWDDVKRRWDLV